MRDASTTSPFVCTETEEAWVTWTSQSPLMTLSESEQTDRRFLFTDHQREGIPPDVADQPDVQPVVINRPQYNAILNRINQAKQKTGAFTSWSTQ